MVAQGALNTPHKAQEMQRGGGTPSRAGSVTPTPTFRLTDNLRAMRPRSVAETQQVGEIMAKVGSWDSHENKYYTQEQQVQSRMMYFQGLSQGLKYSPSDDYDRKQTGQVDNQIVPSRDEAAGNGRRRKIQFGGSGPSPTCIVAGSGLSRQQLADLRKSHPLLKASPVLDVVEELDLPTEKSEPDKPTFAQLSPAAGTPSVRRKTREDISASVPRPQSVAGEVKGGPPPLPRVCFDGSAPYSSLMVQLQRTKRQVHEHTKSLSTVKALMDLEGSVQLKKTITRIFANPSQGEAIAKAEYDKREEQYNAERARMLQQQQEELRDQREELEREIGHLLTSDERAPA